MKEVSSKVAWRVDHVNRRAIKGRALRATRAHDRVHTTRRDSFLELSVLVQITRFRIEVNHTLFNNCLFSCRPWGRSQFLHLSYHKIIVSYEAIIIACVVAWPSTLIFLVDTTVLHHTTSHTYFFTSTSVKFLNGFKCLQPLLHCIVLFCSQNKRLLNYRGKYRIHTHFPMHFERCLAIYHSQETQGT